MTSPSPEPVAVPLDDVAPWIDQYTQARAQLEIAQANVDRIRDIILDRLGDGEVGTVDGRPRVYYRTVTSRRLDTARVKAHLGADYDQWTTTTVSRRFEVKG